MFRSVMIACLMLSALAATAEHWAFQPIENYPIPQLSDPRPHANGIDAFVLQRLQEAGMTPSPEADRVTLIRRLSLDLVGLPPTPAEVDAFVNDDSPYAYERLVNRLLASPHYGERWGRHWLDLARYADSDGFEKDTARPHAWRYRDWVIDALNRDLPYDQFVIEQLAGDLLPGATLEQMVATGFHRNTLTNLEGGVDPEEFRVEQVVDRVNTTAAVFMGLTMACAQCHDHKYDPISQREYFGMFAYFNSGIEENIPAPLDAEAALFEREYERWDARRRELQRDLDRYKPNLKTKRAEWETRYRSEIAGFEWTLLEPTQMESTGGASLSQLEDGSILVEGESAATDTYTIVVPTDLSGITGIRLEVLTHDSLPKKGPGRAHHGNFILSEFDIRAEQTNAPDTAVSVNIADAWADHAERGWPIEEAFDGDTSTGWSADAWRDKNEDRTAIFTLAEDAGFEGGTTLRFRFDHQYGSSHAMGRFRLYAATGPRDHLRTTPELIAAVRTPEADRTDAQADLVLTYYGQRDPDLRALQAALDAHSKVEPKRDITHAQIITENPDPPKTHIHIRGSFMNKGDEVQSHTPAVLPDLKVGGGRLTLAEWLMSPEHPLTARVAVNRLWEKLFGVGLVETSEDFGTRGEAPSHPQLLDWLATEYRAKGWSTKSMIRLIVSSETYRQSAKGRPEYFERDPANRMLARQNRFRVEAEIIRDLFLASSGLLNPTIGGPSVRPPLPDGVSDLGYANSVKWPESEGGSKYRRGLYTFFQRTVPYPAMMTFDCPDSNVTAIRRARSNTPLQALTLLNDPVFFECAQAMAKRVYESGPDEHDERMVYLFRRCLGREPGEAEMRELLLLWDDEHDLINTNGDTALKIVGRYLPEGTQPQEVAPWVTVARAIMNLDEFVTRE